MFGERFGMLFLVSLVRSCVESFSLMTFVCACGPGFRVVLQEPLIPYFISCFPCPSVLLAELP